MLWFGNEKMFQWTPCPQVGLTVSNAGYTSGMLLQNGGRARVRSARYSKVYNISFTDTYTNNINAYTKYASGYYGTGKVYFADPYAFETNLLSPEWASPGIIEAGWKNIGPSIPTFSDTPANSNGLPSRSATWDITTAANATPLTDSTIPYIIIPIPPGYSLRLGARGSITGSSVLKIETWANGAAAPTASANVAVVAPTSTTVLNNIAFSGAYAKIYVTRTSAFSATITLSGIVARLYKTGITPVLTGQHREGDGNRGLQFADEAVVEDYIYMHPPRKGISTTLEEVNR